MAIEIKELVIRAVAVQEKEEAATNAKQHALSEEAIEAIIEQCTQQILKILERKNAR
jgi:hypothetical protein